MAKGTRMRKYRLDLGAHLRKAFLNTAPQLSHVRLHVRQAAPEAFEHRRDLAYFVFCVHNQVLLDDVHGRLHALLRCLHLGDVSRRLEELRP